jgi:hypothetical protein
MLWVAVTVSWPRTFYISVWLSNLLSVCTYLIKFIPVTHRNKLVINIFITFTGRIPQGVIRPVVNMSPLAYLWDICITEIYRSLITLFLKVKSVFPHVASSIPIHFGVYSIQHYLIMFFSDYRHIAGFLHH